MQSWSRMLIILIENILTITSVSGQFKVWLCVSITLGLGRKAESQAHPIHSCIQGIGFVIEFNLSSTCITCFTHLWVAFQKGTRKMTKTKKAKKPSFLHDRVISPGKRTFLSCQSDQGLGILFQQIVLGQVPILTQGDKVL